MRHKKTNRAVLTAALVALVLPLINILVFRGLGIYFLTEPMKYPAALADTMKFIYEFFTGILSFLPPLCIARALLTQRNRGSVWAISALSVPAVYAVMISEDTFINQKAVSAATVKAAGLDWLSVLAGYILVTLAVILVKRKSKKAPLEAELFSLHGLLSRGTAVTTAVIAVIAFIQLGFETYVLVASYGAPDNASQVIELATPYLTLIIGAFIGYAAGCVLIMRKEGSHTSQTLRK